MAVPDGWVATVFARWPGNFFKALHHLGILADVARTRRDVREAKRHQQLADTALVIVHAETRPDQRLEIQAPPAHHPIPLAIGTALDDPRQLLQLRRQQPRRRPAGLAVDQAVGAAFVEPVNPVPQRLPIHAPDTRRITTAHPVVGRRDRQKPPGLSRILGPGRKRSHISRPVVLSQRNRQHQIPSIGVGYLESHKI